jgi:hypothetical protein
MKIEPLTKPKARPFSWWLWMIVILGALLTAAGGIIALVHPSMLVSPREQMNGAVHIYAGYLAARSLAISFLLLVLLFIGARRALGNLMVLVGLIQLLDTCMDVAEGRRAIIPVVFVFGLVFLWSAACLSGGYPFWRIEAWKLEE